MLSHSVPHSHGAPEKGTGTMLLIFLRELPTVLRMELRP